MSEYFAPSSNDFLIEATFLIENANFQLSNHAYILTGGLDFTWCIGVNENLELAFWIGDGTTWCHLEQLACSHILKYSVEYNLKIERKQHSLILSLNSEVILDITLDEGFIFSGSHIYKNGFKNIPSKWNIKTNLRNFQIFLPTQEKFGREIHLISFFYGKNYCNLFEKYLLPSLMNKANIPTIQNERRVCHFVYCKDADYPHLQNALKTYASLGIEIEVDTKILNNADSTSKKYLNIPVEESIIRSYEDGSIVVVAQPDHIFGLGLKNTIDRMNPYDYIVCGHPRVDMQSIASEYSKLPYFASNEELVKFAMSLHPHPMVQHGLKNQENYWHALENASNYVTYFKEPPPLCFHGSPDMISVMHGDIRYSPFESIDHELVDYMFSQNRLGIVDNSSEFFWCELTDNRVYNPTIRNDYVSAAAKKLGQHPLIWNK
ncbi:hypothetical protein LIN78_01485 [Leeia sp. TBRC 13508]|uniref:Glycosyltransferase n=1 Tax=Leeia speluncae TaxID=2884804 RepID=A0ABS8D202_9NEIS|nr:hypothetical protein [Leeia speluncae]MCB6182228.1 hypothetical protein [Leeia speluncae]